MAKLIILRGNSGSGKSSTARALQKALGAGALLIPQDTVRRDMLLARDGADTPALPLLIALMRYGHEHCEYTILEGILRADWYRPLFEAAQALFGAQMYAYYYDIPYEETLRRHQSRPQRAEFGEAELRRWWLEKDVAGLPNERIFTQEISLEAAVRTICEDVKQVIG